MKPSISVTVHAGDTVMTAVVESHLGRAVGEAKCHPKDTFNPYVGEKLAVGRALVKLGEKLIEDAEDIIYPQQYIESPF